MKGDLHDPDSFEHHETRIEDTRSRPRSVSMEFSATNLQGGRQRMVAAGEQAADCTVAFYGMRVGTYQSLGH